MNPEIVWLGHASFRIESEAGRIYIDPWKLKTTPAADYILVTHSHFDHLSLDDIARIRNDDTVIVGPEDVAEKLDGVTVIAPGEVKKVGRIEVEAHPAYNPKKDFHPESSGWLGFVVDLSGYRIYHTGDADVIPEMGRLERIDVALIPVGGTYTMDPAEAAEAVAMIKPRKAIPMHWGDIVGDRGDAEAFQRLASCEVEILDPTP